MLKKLHLTATGAAVMLVLSACTSSGNSSEVPSSSPSSPTASPSATATPTPAASIAPSSTLPAPVTGQPTSAEDAVDKATAAAEAWYVAEDIVFNDAGRSPERIEPYATDTALADSYDFAEQISQLKTGTEYHRELEVLDSWSAPRGQVVNGEMKTVEHGSVGLDICNDVTGNVYHDPQSEPSIKRATGTLEVYYSPANDAWKVAQVDAAGTESQEC